MEKYEGLDRIVHEASVNPDPIKIKEKIDELGDPHDKLYVSGKLLTEVGQYGHWVVPFLADTIIEANEEARKFSVTDGLTGLFNRGHLDITLETELASHYERHNNKDPFSIMMFDIDYFKKFNDVYGHKAGDSVLKRLGSIIRDNVRVADVPHRYGGEEFTVVFPDTYLSGALKVADKLNKIIADTEMVFFNEDNREVREAINISAGVIEINRDNPVRLLYGKSGQKLIKNYISKTPDFIHDAHSYLDLQDNGLTEKTLMRDVEEIGGFVENYLIENKAHLDNLSIPEVGINYVIDGTDKLLYHVKKNGRNNVAYMKNGHNTLLKK